VADFFEHGDEPLGSIKGKDFLTSWEAINFWRKTLPWS